MPTVTNRYGKPRPRAQLVEIEKHSLGDPYRIIEGEKVYAEKITKKGTKPKSGESYRNIYR